MSREVIIYKSKYGTTQKYAKLISIKSNIDLLELSLVKPNDLLKYDTIIFGGSLYMGKIQGIKFISDNYSKIKKKNLMIFSVGLSASDQKSLADIRKQNFTQAMINDKLPLIHLPGKIVFNKLTFLHRSLMKMIISSLRKKEDLTAADKNMLNSYDNPKSTIEKPAIEPIISFIKRNS